MARARGNRSAQRLLAVLLVVAVLRLMPYVLGFAGAYDAWPWLSFAPFGFSSKASFNRVFREQTGMSPSV